MTASDLVLYVLLPTFLGQVGGAIIGLWLAFKIIDWMDGRRK